MHPNATSRNIACVKAVESPSAPYPDKNRSLPMPRMRRKRILWTSADVKALKQLSGKQSAKQIARHLKRSEAAVRFKAWQMKLSLGLTGRARAKSKRARRG